LEVTKGDPIQSVVHVRFDTTEVGAGRVAYALDERWHTTDEGERGRTHEAVIWIPAGERVEFRPELVLDGGTVREGRSRSVKPAKPPRALSPLTVTVADEDRSEILGGRLAVNLFDGHRAFATILDGQGRLLWWAEAEDSDDKVLRVRPGRDGKSVLFASYDGSRIEDHGWITRWDLHPQVQTRTRAVGLHHDWVELPDGRLSWLSWVYENTWVDGIGQTDLVADAIRVSEPGGEAGDEAQVFSMLEDYPFEPSWSCAHMTEGGFVPGYSDWTHANSLIWDDEASAWRMLVRHLDAVIEVGEDGFHWQVGGRNSDLDVSDWFDHGHASALTGDRWLVFDNGNHAPDPRVSRVAEFTLDFQAGIAERTWERVDPEERFSGYLGDIIELPGGNRLIAWAPHGHLQEITPEGLVVWEAWSDLTVGRLSFAGDLAP